MTSENIFISRYTLDHLAMFNNTVTLDDIFNKKHNDKTYIISYTVSSFLSEMVIDYKNVKQLRTDLIALLKCFEQSKQRKIVELIGIKTNEIKQILSRKRLPTSKEALKIGVKLSMMKNVVKEQQDLKGGLTKKQERMKALQTTIKIFNKRCQMLSNKTKVTQHYIWTRMNMSGNTLGATTIQSLFSNTHSYNPKQSTCEKIEDWDAWERELDIFYIGKLFEFVETNDFKVEDIVEAIAMPLSRFKRLDFIRKNVKSSQSTYFSKWEGLYAKEREQINNLYPFDESEFYQKEEEMDHNFSVFFEDAEEWEGPKKSYKDLHKLRVNLGYGEDISYNPNDVEESDEDFFDEKDTDEEDTHELYLDGKDEADISIHSTDTENLEEIHLKPLGKKYWLYKPTSDVFNYNDEGNIYYVGKYINNNLDFNARQSMEISVKQLYKIIRQLIKPKNLSQKSQKVKRLNEIYKTQDEDEDVASLDDKSTDSKKPKKKTITIEMVPDDSLSKEQYLELFKREVNRQWKEENGTEENIF